MTNSHLTAEEARLKDNRERTKYWKKWGPYLGERQWATVREDYSASGDAWSDFPFDHSRSRTYRWGEDGLAGVSDNHQVLCLSLSLWNENDDILKEKAFGVTGPQGNHGEDVKELYYYLDNTPSHSYMKYLYKYPHGKFPYKQLVEENGKRSREELEYEITDTGIFDDNNYFDVVFEMAKDDDDPDVLFFRVTAYNRGASPAPLHILPHVVFRNTWGWGIESEEGKPIPKLSKESKEDDFSIKIDHYSLGSKRLTFAPAPGVTEGSPDVEPKLLFTDNETNYKRLYNQDKNVSKYVKDAFHDYIIDEEEDSVNPENYGTKAAAWFSFDKDGGVPPGDYVTIRYKMSPFTNQREDIDEVEFDEVFARRQDEADEFYWKITPLPISDELRQVQRQAFAGLLWTKQFYHFIYDAWANGDPSSPPPPKHRAGGRNKEWKHLYIDDILSLPDKWEYPFFAAWDTAFHCVPLSMVDPDFAKRQLDILTREWYMHPNGQIPAYEWNFSDVNPPVHAWATFRVFNIERRMYGREDLDFLERVFQKLLLNFTWWVNRKDADGNNLFSGGFLGLDNIGIFNRSEPLPTGGTLEQADSTGWMAFFCLQMLNIALELSKTRKVYEDIASKFFEHFLLIADAMAYTGVHKAGEAPTEKSLWNEKDQFYYDAISYGGEHSHQLEVRSLVGLIPLYASLTLEPEILDKFPSFKSRVSWFIKNRKNAAQRNIASMDDRGVGDRILLALADKDRLVAILEKMLDENEFLSDYGIRSLSKFHEKNPFEMNVNGQQYTVKYLPGESDSGLFGGNSNWRGPIWFPTNFLLVEALQRFYLYYGPELKVECPKGSGQYLNLAQVAQEIQHRLIHLFVPDENGDRACNGGNELFNKDPLFKDCVPFYEYFHGDTGRGLGASHQCGWTALVAKWIHDNGATCRTPRTPRSQRSSISGDYFFGGGNSEGDLEQYYPKAGPFSSRLMRRRSGKSLLNLTVNALDLGEDETISHNRRPFNRTTVRHDEIDLADRLAKSGLDEANSRRSSMSLTEEEASRYNENLLGQIKKAFSNFVPKDEDDVSSDEFEIHS